MPENVLFNISRALSDKEIASVYALAEKYKVGVCLWQNTPSPARAASEWAVSGKARRVLPFLLQMRKFK